VERCLACEADGSATDNLNRRKGRKQRDFLQKGTKVTKVGAGRREALLDFSLVRQLPMRVNLRDVAAGGAHASPLAEGSRIKMVPFLGPRKGIIARWTETRGLIAEEQKLRPGIHPGYRRLGGREECLTGPSRPADVWLTRSQVLFRFAAFATLVFFQAKSPEPAK
jgi:hypothetical protein